MRSVQMNKLGLLVLALGLVAQTGYAQSRGSEKPGEKRGSERDARKAAEKSREDAKKNEERGKAADAYRSSGEKVTDAQREEAITRAEQLREASGRGRDTDNPSTASSLRQLKEMAGSNPELVSLVNVFEKVTDAALVKGEAAPMSRGAIESFMNGEGGAAASRITRIMEEALQSHKSAGKTMRECLAEAAERQGLRELFESKCLI